MASRSFEMRCKTMQLRLCLKRPHFRPAGGAVLGIGLVVERMIERLRRGLKRPSGLFVLLCC